MKCPVLIFHYHRDRVVPAARNDSGGSEAAEVSTAGSLLTDGSFEAGNMAEDWKKNYSSATYPAALVENRDFLNGTRCMKLTASPDAPLSVISRNLPAMPGKQLRLSFWAKGEGIRVFDCCIEIWSPVKHRREPLYIRRKFHLSDD